MTTDETINNESLEVVARAIDGSASKQPRFQEVNPTDFFFSTMNWTKMVGQDAPEYELRKAQERDLWLSKFWHLEPHLAGVLHSLISIDSNRGWELTGGRNQVLRYTRILHNWAVAPGLYGWRAGTAASSLSFYTADLGAPVEIGRDGKNGPVRGFFHVDPTRCQLTGDMETPLKYRPTKRGRAQEWGESDYLRMVSMPSILETMNGLGYCFESRALELAQLMVAVYQHDREELGAQAPRGLMILHGITEQQWKDAMSARKVELAGDELQYYSSVAVLADGGMGDEVEAKLIALSNLPAGFDLQQFTSMLMYGYALAAGYDPSEFYPVQFGSLGRGTEMSVQHQKATAKGGLNYALTLQEQLVRPDVLPETLQMEFDQRDDQGELTQADVALAWTNVYKAARESGLGIDQEGGISREEFRSLLAEKGIIPTEWTEIEEDSKTTDTDDDVGRKRRKRDELLSKPAIWRAIDQFPSEAIVRYRWPEERVSTLWERADELLKPMSWGIRMKRAKSRQDAPEVLYEDDDVQITEEDVDIAIEEGRRRVGQEWAELMDNLPIEEE